MKKNDLIAAMAEKTGLSKKDTEATLNAFIETIGETLKAGDKVTLVGFGSFEVSERGERQGVNPRTGEAMTIKASKSPKFKAGKGFKDMIV